MGRGLYFRLLPAAAEKVGLDTQIATDDEKKKADG